MRREPDPAAPPTATTPVRPARGRAGVVARARSRGEVAPALGVEDVVRAVLALATGHAAQLLDDPRPEAEVRAHVAEVLRVLLGPG